MTCMYETPPTSPRDWISPTCSSVGYSEGLMTPMKPIRILSEFDSCERVPVMKFSEEYAGTWNPFIDFEEQKFSSGEERLKKGSGRFTKLSNGIQVDNIDGCEYLIRDSNLNELTSFIACSEQNLCVKYINSWESNCCLRLQTSAVLSTMSDEHNVDILKIKRIIESAAINIEQHGLSFSSLSMDHFTNYKFNSFPCLVKGGSSRGVIDAFISSLECREGTRFEIPSETEYTDALLEEIRFLENKLKSLKPVNETLLLSRPFDDYDEVMSTPPPTFEITEAPPKSKRALAF